MVTGTATRQQQQPQQSSIAVESPLSQRVKQAILDANYAVLQDVHVTAEGNRVVLNGRVPTYYAKQLAQTLAMYVDGVDSLENRTVVH